MVGKLVTSPRGVTYYWIERNANPNAPCIVFTHGIAVNHHLFDKQVAFFTRDYTIITWDLPMHGRSKSYRDFSYVHAAEEMESIIQREKLKRVILVSVGIGAYVCQEYASQHPEKVQAFVGVGAMPFGNDYYTASDISNMRCVPTFVKRLPEGMVHRALARERGFSRYGYHNALAMIEQMSKRELIYAFAAAFQDRFTHKKRVDFQCPVLLVVGALDYAGKFAEYTRKWAEQTGYTMAVMQNAAHNANADAYDAFNDMLSKFLRRNLNKENTISPEQS